MLFDHFGRRKEALRVSQNELPQERPQVRPEAPPEAGLPVRVFVREDAEVLFDLPLDLLPLEPDRRVLPLEERAELPLPLRSPLPDRLTGLVLRVEGEKDPLLNLPGFALTFPVDDGDLASALADVGHGNLRERLLC